MLAYCRSISLARCNLCLPTLTRMTQLTQLWVYCPYARPNLGSLHSLRDLTYGNPLASQDFPLVISSAAELTRLVTPNIQVTSHKKCTTPPL